MFSLYLFRQQNVRDFYLYLWMQFVVFTEPINGWYPENFAMI